MSRQYITARQRLWAQRQGIGLQSKQGGGQDESLYTNTLLDNLFEPLLPETQKAFQDAAGSEMSGNPCNMQALHSSAALAVNVLQYWQRIQALDSLAEGLKIPVSGANSLVFEAQLPIDAGANQGRFPRAPNLDALVEYEDSKSTRAVGIESKFSETYSSSHKGLKPAYLEVDCLWANLPKLKAFARTISPGAGTFKFLDAAQLIKHALGLHAHTKERGGFWLLYLYYDAPGAKAAAHRAEIEKFEENYGKEFRFKAMSYQEAIMAFFSQGKRSAHRSYLDYVAERYL
ncbi:MAG: hypothetical protein P1V97_26810 [Planctomycetota bacterium]|nr:hypothetical protein [Planctomycetota bacterium]